MSKVRKRSLTPNTAESSEPEKKRRTPPDTKPKAKAARTATSSRSSSTGTRRKSRKDDEIETESSASSSQASSLLQYDSENIKSLNISQLLDIGEGQNSQVSCEKMGKVESTTFSEASDSEEDEEDWEEVKMEEKAESKDPVIPKEGVNVVLEVPELNYMKRKKKGFDLESHIKRQMNQVKRELQLLMHKVHILCWIAHIRFVNTVLNSEIMLGTALSLVTSKNLYPPKYADLSYLERILKWYHSTITLKEFTKIAKCTGGLSEELLYQFQNKSAFSKRYFVFMLIVLLRTLGLKTRLVMSFQVIPIRPKNIELHNSGESKKTPDTQKEAKSNVTNLKSGKTCLKKTIKSEGSRIPKSDSSGYFTSNQTPVKKVVRSEGSTSKCGDSSYFKNEEGSAQEQGMTENKSKMKLKGAGASHSNKNLDLNEKKVEPENSEFFDKKSMVSSDNRESSSSQRKLRSKKVLLGDSESDDDLTSKHFKCSNKQSQSPRVNSLNKKSNIRSKKVVNGVEDSSDSSKCGEKKRELISGNTPKSCKTVCTNVKKKTDQKVQANTKDEKKNKKMKNQTIKKESGKSSKVKNEIIQKANDSSDNDDDFRPQSLTKKVAQSVTDRSVLSSDEEGESSTTKNGVNQWIEVFLEAEEKWITVDAPRQKIHCVNEIYSRANHPVAYIVACNPNSTLKDVTKRYVPNWHSDTRKRRVDEIWWNETMAPYIGTPTAQDREEDEDINKQLLEKPLPTTISEFKDHPLYALKRHLLKFEGIYPANAPTLGFVRGEPVYARECVVTLRSREMWYKEARVVRLKEEPYKIVKARPKFDKMTGLIKKDLPLELYGFWQTDEYIPPIAFDGKVPRNEYGNVDLFKPCMLPTGTVHLQIPALNRVAKKLGIDCAPAVVGFDFHSGASHPITDGFVVCEEFKEVLLDAWNKEIDETDRRNEEKKMKRVYGNWKRLIRGLLIREKLKLKYSFGGEPTDQNGSEGTSGRKKKSSKK